MKYLNSHIAISHKGFLEETKRDKSVFYFLPEFHQYNGLPKWHGELHDGVIKDEKSIYLYIAEHDYFIKNSEFISDFYKKDNHIKKIYYQAEFANKEELGCKGSISVLGRAFFSKTSYITWGEQPRGTLSYNIIQHKEQEEKNEFTKWDKVLVEAMKEYLIAFIKLNAEDDNNFESDILRSEYGTKIILTSMPNSDGNSRFNNFLNEFDNIGDNIFIYKDFFTHTRTSEDTRANSYSKKMKILKDLYTVNEKYVK